VNISLQLPQIKISGLPVKTERRHVNAETLFQQVAAFCFLYEEKKRVLHRMGGRFVPFRATRQQIARSIN